MSDFSISRRGFLASAAAGFASAVVAAPLVNSLPAQQPARRSLPAGLPKDIVIYKDPNCGCCTEWVKHVQAAGFTTTIHDTPDMSTVRTTMGVPVALQSCHTAKVGNYLVEGHVPADLIVRMLTEKKADMRGIAVPGMPAGSPGMEMGARKDRYDVMAFDKAGKSRVYASR